MDTLLSIPMEVVDVLSEKHIAVLFGGKGGITSTINGQSKVCTAIDNANNCTAINNHGTSCTVVNNYQSCQVINNSASDCAVIVNPPIEMQG